MAPPPPLPPPRPSGSSGKAWLWLLFILVLIGGLALAGLVVVFEMMDGSDLGTLASRSSSARPHLHEVLVKAADTRDKIAVIDVDGVISGDPVDYQGTTLVSHIEDQLERAADDDLVKAVLLKINSPGGEVLASDEIYKLVMEFQEEHDKPVIATMGTVAASGGYYVAAPCRWIVCHDLTITGSIGVIMQSYNWRGLFDKVGVRPQVFKSGQMKDMMSPDKAVEDITVEERRIVQDLVNETFGRFKDVVNEGRALAHSRNEDNEGETPEKGRALARNWEEFADGRLLSGKEAWKLGLVDELGDFNAAVKRAQKLAGLEEARLIQYFRPASFGSLFRLLGQGEESKVKLDLGVRLPQIRSGLYYLAPNLVR